MSTENTGTITIAEAVKLLGIPQESVLDEFGGVCIRKIDVTEVFNRRLQDMGKPVVVVAPGKPPEKKAGHNRSHMVTFSTEYTALDVLAKKAKVSTATLRARAVYRGIKLYTCMIRRPGYNLPAFRNCVSTLDAAALITTSPKK